MWWSKLTCSHCVAPCLPSQTWSWVWEYGSEPRTWEFRALACLPAVLTTNQLMTAGKYLLPNPYDEKRLEGKGSEKSRCVWGPTGEGLWSSIHNCWKAPRRWSKATEGHLEGFHISRDRHAKDKYRWLSQGLMASLPCENAVKVRSSKKKKSWGTEQIFFSI